MSRKRVAEEGPLTCLPDLGLAAKIGGLAAGEAPQLPPTPATTRNEERLCKSLTKVCLVGKSSTAPSPALPAHSYSRVCTHAHGCTNTRIWRGACSREMTGGGGSTAKPKPPVSPSQELSPELPQAAPDPQPQPTRSLFHTRAGRLLPRSAVTPRGRPSPQGSGAVPVQTAATTARRAQPGAGLAPTSLQLPVPTGAADSP